MPKSILRMMMILSYLGIFLVDKSQAADERRGKETPPGVVFVVGGVGGFDLLSSGAQAMLPKVGVKHEIRDFVWTHGKGKYFRDLQDHRHMHQKAQDLATQIRQIKEETPYRPVFLVGKSGGAGLVLAAAELLPPGTLERIILLSAAVSTTYDLCPALRATKREIVSFYSIHDTFILGWGTTQFGTIDRFYAPSAGLKRFAVPEHLNPPERALYDRLVQIPWKPAMIFEGYWGGHLGTSMPSFVAGEVGPWLQQ